MRIVDVVAYSVRHPQDYLFGNPDNASARYFLRAGFPTVYSTGMETLLVRVETDSGLVGWGEALAPVVPEAVAAVVVGLLRPLVLGADPLDVEPLWDRMYGSMRVRGHLTGLFVDACAAVDVALWDILGKALAQPVSRLLGGRRRDHLPVYHSGVAGQTPTERAVTARSLVAAGFTGLKLHLGYGTEDVATVAAVREAVGPDVKIMLDGHWSNTVAQALAIGRSIEAYGAFFFEAPIVPEDTAGLAELARSLTVPIAIGEGERTRWQFLSLLQARALDVAQPDVGRTGLTEARRIATLCDAFNVPIAPHVSTGLGIRYAATLHFAAAIGNFLILEHQGGLFDAVNESLRTPLEVVGGEIAVPTGPGLGVELDEAALAPYWTEHRG